MATATRTATSGTAAATATAVSPLQAAPPPQPSPPPTNVPGLAYLTSNKGNIEFLSFDGSHWASPIGVGQQTDLVPCLAASVSNFWMAFIAQNPGWNNAIFVCCSSDQGKTWASAPMPNQQSKRTPALAWFQNKLWMAFIAENPGLNNAILVCSTADGINWTNWTKTEQQSGGTPALALFKGELWMAFRSNTTKEILVCSSSNGTTWSNSTPTGQTSGHAPALAVFEDKLWLAFIAENPGLNNAILVCSSKQGREWTNWTKTNHQSTTTPALAAAHDELWMAFHSYNANDVLVCRTTDPGAGRWTNTNANQTSSYAPALAVLSYQTGYLYPAYMLLGVQYAPPGGVGQSTCTYTSEGASGTTTSVSSSFTNSDNVGVTAGDQVNNASVSIGSSATTTNTSSVQVTQTLSSENGVIKQSSGDGIDHDSDLFWLWVNAQVTVSQDLSGRLQYLLGFNGKATTYSLTVAQVKDAVQSFVSGIAPESIPANEWKALCAAGLNQADYQQILAANPFVSTGTGYKVGDVLTLQQQGASDGKIKVESVLTGADGATGSISTLSIQSNGHGYTTAYGISAKGGSGNGAKFSITVDASGGIATVTYVPTAQISNKRFAYVTQKEYVPHNELAQEFSLSSEKVNTESIDNTFETTASMKLSTGFPDVIQLTADDTMTWTTTCSQTETSSSVQTADCVLYWPGKAWGDNPSNPTQVGVYWDTAYNTFMFALTD